MIYKNICDLIGKTPLLRLGNYIEQNGLAAEIIAKLEYFNPAGSAKDRVGFYMIKDAEKRGILKPDSVIIEPTSGNTGIGLAAVAASLGYRVLLTMPESMSVERRKLLAAYGAEIVLTPADEGMNGAVKKAEELNKKTKNSFIAGQFVNPANALAHYETTGPEIWSDTEGRVDIFVAGAGTGGTITGVGRYLKEKNPDVKIVAVEPESSPLLSKGISGAHKLQGIGANFVPDVLDKNIYDEIICVSDDDALNTMKTLANTEGLLVGITSGAAVFASKVLAQREENKGKNIVALLPDTGTRYMSEF